MRSFYSLIELDSVKLDGEIIRRFAISSWHEYNGIADFVMNDSGEMKCIQTDEIIEHYTIIK